MMHERWTGMLSDYLDDELPEGERSALEAHLAECAGCRTVLVELGTVVARAGAIEDRPPREELWDGIAARIGAQAPAVRRLGAKKAGRFGSSSARRLMIPLPQLAAAAVVLLALGGAAGWMGALLTGGNGGSAAVALAPVAPSEGVEPRLAANAGAADPALTAAVEELESMLAEARGRLSPSTIRTLETNLAIIDAAIADAQRAVASDPANAYLQTHLANVQRRKMMLLQRAASLAAAQT